MPPNIKNKIFALVFFAVSASEANSSDFGVTGLIDVPSARMASDGSLSLTAAIQSQTNSYSITYQATPWLEGTFRYTGSNDFFYWDRNFEAKIRLWREYGLLPQVAIGIRDLVGTGKWGSEYIVSSKQVGNFDFTLGIGWGRLAGSGDLANPLIKLDKSFEIRPDFEGKGGEFFNKYIFQWGKSRFFWRRIF